MGVSIDLHIYDYLDLVSDISRTAESQGIPEGRSVQEFVDIVLPKFGIRAGDKFIVLWNEYYDDYNSGSEMLSAVDMYFGTEGYWFDDYKIGGNSNAHEVFESLEIEPIEDES